MSHIDNIVTIQSAMDQKKRIKFHYVSKNKDEGEKEYALTPKWWLANCNLRMFQAGDDGDNKRFHVSDIKGAVSVL